MAHPAVRSENLSAFSSLLSALEEHRVDDTFVQDTFRVPRTLRGLPLKPMAPWRGQRTIRFHAVPDIYRGRGVPLGLVSSGIAPGRVLMGCEDPVFGGCAPVLLTLRISWPGYKTLDCVAKVPLRCPGTRLDVAVAVFQQYNRMFERAHTEPNPSHQSWVIGKTGITIHNLILLSVSNDAEDVYEAELHVALNRYDPSDVFASLQLPC